MAPGLGYRISSDRQPGIEQANMRRMPQQRMGPRPFPPERGYLPPERGYPGPIPLPSPMPDREFDFRRNMPLPVPMPSPDRRFDFRPERFSPMMPRERQGIENLMPYREDAAVDPSDYRTIMKIIEQGLNPEDYMASTGIMGALPEERQVAELGLPQPLDYQNERLSLDELIELGASQEQIAQYLGVA